MQRVAGGLDTLAIGRPIEGRIDVHRFADGLWTRTQVLQGATGYGSSLEGSLRSPRLLIVDDDEVKSLAPDSNGQYVVAATLPAPSGYVPIGGRGLVQEQTDNVFAAATFVREGGPATDRLVVVYRADSGADPATQWTSVAEVQPFVVIEAATFGEDLAMANGTLAIGAPAVPGGNRNGTVQLMDYSGAVVLGAVVGPPNDQDRLTPNVYSGFGQRIALNPNGEAVNLLVSSPEIGTVDRFRETPFGQFQLLDRIVARGRGPLLIGDQVSGVYDSGGYRRQALGDPADLQILCANTWDPSGAGNLVLESFQPEFSPDTVSFSTGDFPGRGVLDSLFLVGFEPATAPLGAGVLCLAEPVRRLRPTRVIDLVVSESAIFELQGAAVGALAGQQILLQAWRPDPAFAGGVTTNAYSLVLRP